MRFRSVAVVCALALAVGCGDVPIQSTVSYERPPTAPAISAWSPGLGPPIAFRFAVDALELWHATETWNRALQIQASEVASRPPPVAVRPPAAPKPRQAPNPAPKPPAATGPTVGGDVWAALARCESGMTNANTGNGFYGYFQFVPSTWRGIGESGLPTDHSYETQRAAAQRLQARSGWGQWPACSRSLGLR